jgi:hypothetical protein
MKVNEVTFNSLEEFKSSKYGTDEDASYWVSQGRPKVWIKTYDKNDVQGYCEIGYGALKLVVKGVVAESSGYSHALTNGDYIILTAYYGEEYNGAIFKRIS